MPLPAGRTPGRSRPSYLAAPPLLSESEPFEGADVLREHPGALGALLWKSLRDVTAWTEAAQDDRPALFNAAAAQARTAEVAACGAEPELWAPLLVIAQLLRCPGDVDYARLVNACRAAARWGERRGFTAVQLGFTQAAARLAPAHPRLAYAVGRLSRDRGEYARAETWLRASIRLARGTDWHTYALAYLSLGTLYQQLGNLPAARAVTERGLRTTVRRRLRRLEGTAYHNLCVLAGESGDYARAQRCASAALQRYGAGHPRLPALAYDLGLVWFLCGYFDRALPVFEAVLAHMPESVERAMGLANTARAAAGAGDRVRFERYWMQADCALATCEVQPAVAEGWLALARGAVLAGDAGRAQAAAARAGEIAAALRLAQLRFEADAVLESARTTVTLAPPRDAEGERVFREAGELATRMVQSLALVPGA
jgi:tetratricopeptide (TPR) repeat protein